MPSLLASWVCVTCWACANWREVPDNCPICHGPVQRLRNGCLECVFLEECPDPLGVEEGVKGSTLLFSPDQEGDSVLDYVGR